MTSIAGTEAADTLTGTVGADEISGLGGSDEIRGEAGNDALRGGDGGDRLFGGPGDDVVEGGADDDRIEDGDGGSDTLRGDGGNDAFFISRSNRGVFEQVRVEGGTGDDQLTYQNYNGSSLSVDMGEGEDGVTLYTVTGATTIKLGSGQDTLEFHQLLRLNVNGPVTVTDFATGAAGDRLEWTSFLGGYLSNWDQSANPFGSGHLRLVQQGSSSLLQVDRDGGGDGYATLITFQNASAPSFTAHNLDGFPRDGSAVPGKRIIGTEGGDTLVGTVGSDDIDGLGGSDEIRGEAGNDLVRGGDGRDRLFGGAGDDVVEGGADDDRIEDGDGGSDTLRGGDGDDIVFISRSNRGVVEQVRVEGGIGNDALTYQNYNSSSLSVDMGEGEDALTLYTVTGATTIRLGGGRDTLELHQLLRLNIDGPITVTDFVTGAAGDRLEWTSFLGGYLGNWDQAGNPFASGHLRLVQQGSSSLLQVDRDGGGDGYATLITFQNASAPSFTAHNLDGWLPGGLTYFGGAGDDQLVGSDGDDMLFGFEGADILKGGSGADWMVGGPGNDIFYVGTATDKVIEAPGEGNDTVHASISYSLAGRPVENLVLTGTGAINASGNGGANFLTGNVADNRLDGGAGADRMTGGGGNDTYVVDHAADVAFEVSGGGVDTVESRIDYVLPAEIERLTLTRTAANGTGNALANILTGNDMANLLNGGAGADVLRGGANDDFYVIDAAGDQVVELAGQGIDTVRALASFTLSDHVERLELAGGGSINGTGNALANLIVGNDAANRLNGAAGADTMIGGKGHDIYVIDTPGDKVIEGGSSGNDTVESAVGFSLPTHVEKLILTGALGYDGRGNSGANTITGNSAGNFLNGGSGNDVIDAGAGNDRLLGSLGNDSLKGGAGSDRFEFTTALSAANVDRILDFSVADDSIHLLRSVFTRAGANGTLAAAAFHQGTAAHDASDRIVYDQASGKIFYDADGTGAATAILFATVTPGMLITNADFVIYG